MVTAVTLRWIQLRQRKRWERIRWLDVGAGGDLVDCSLGAIPAASTFSVQASTSDRPRHNASKASDSDGVVSHEEEAVIRHEATGSGSSRPHLRPCRAAAGSLFDDPVLALSWPLTNLPGLGFRRRSSPMVSDCEVLKESI